MDFGARRFSKLRIGDGTEILGRLGQEGVFVRGLVVDSLDGADGAVHRSKCSVFQIQRRLTLYIARMTGDVDIAIARMHPADRRMVPLFPNDESKSRSALGEMNPSA